MVTIVPVLLEDNLGKSLWLLSRQLYPKQFCKVIDDKPYTNRLYNDYCLQNIIF